MFKKLFLCLGLLGFSAFASDTSPDIGQKIADYRRSISSKNYALLGQLFDTLSESDCKNPCFFYHKAALEVALRHGRRDLFNLFRKKAKKCHIDVASSIAGCPGKFFRMAVEGGNVELIKYVLFFVPVSERSELFNLPEDENCLKNSIYCRAEAFEYLIQQGARLGEANCNFEIYRVLIDGKTTATLDCLLNHLPAQECQQFFTNPFGPYGDNAFLLAARNYMPNGTETLKWVIQKAQQYGVNPVECMTGTNNFGESIFFSAAMGGKADTMRFLLDFMPAEKSLELIHLKNKRGESAWSLIKESVDHFALSLRNKDVDDGTDFIQQNKEISDMLTNFQKQHSGSK